MEKRRKYTILASAQAVLGGVIALSVAGLYLLQPSSLPASGLSQIVAGLGLVTALYYLSLHQFLKRSFLGASTAAITVLSVLNLMILVAATGGFDSPFFSFWLIAIAAAGLFGSLPIALMLAGTTVGFCLAWAAQDFSGQYMAQHVVQLLATLATAGLARWIYLQVNHTHQEQKAVSVLSNQLDVERLRAQVLMSSMADAVMVIDQSNRIQLMNRAAQEMTGWDAESVQNVDYHLVMPLVTAAGQPAKPEDDPFQQSLRINSGVVKNDLTLAASGGQRHALSISVSPIYTADKTITGAIAVFRDISKDKEIERQRSEFVSTASHEMRTPVAAIEGYISLALNPKIAMVDDRARNYLNKAHENIQHLGELFRDLLNVTKVEQGQLSKELTAVNLTKLISDIVNDMQFGAQKKNLSLTFSPQAGGHTTRSIMPLYYVKADVERIREVVMNLIDNAIKYTPAGGITVGLVGDDKTVNVGIHDTGPGIAAENIPHLFQKFYRVDSSATRTIGGTGLGLYLCRAVIELHGGRIWAESTVGQGTTFYFNLPRLPADQVVSAPDEPQQLPEPSLATAQPAAPAQPQPAVAAVLAQSPPLQSTTSEAVGPINP